MPEAQSITEAILRRLGGFAQNVGGQIQTNQDINRELARRAGIDQQTFEANQLQRSIQNELAQSREQRAQQQFDIRNPMGPPAPAVPERFKSVGALEASILQDAFEEGGIEAFATTRQQLKADGQAKPKTPTITPLQRKRLIDERIGERQEGILDRSAATDIQGLRNLSQEGLARTKDAPGLFTGDISDPDRTAFNLLEEFGQAGSAEARQAINDSIQRGLLFPELGIAGQGAQQQDPDSIGRATYDDWDQMTDAQRAELIRLGFPTE